MRVMLKYQLNYSVRNSRTQRLPQALKRANYLSEFKTLLLFNSQAKLMY